MQCVNNALLALAELPLLVVDGITHHSPGDTVIEAKTHADEDLTNKVDDHLNALGTKGKSQQDRTAHQTNGSANLVSLYAERIGKQSFSGAGAGGWPTASNVLGDCLQIAGGASAFYSDKPVTPLPIDNQDAPKSWLFRSFGRYTVRQETAADAFEAYAAVIEADPGALLAYLPYGML